MGIVTFVCMNARRPSYDSLLCQCAICRSSDPAYNLIYTSFNFCCRSHGCFDLRFVPSALPWKLCLYIFRCILAMLLLVTNDNLILCGYLIFVAM
jgi:hypothetical protein